MVGATEEHREQRELVAALKHDLAKYVAWRSANYDDAAWQGPMSDDFAASLQADVLQTKGDVPGWQVWDEAATTFGDPLPHPELVRVAAAIDVLRGCEDALRSGGDALAGCRDAIRGAQQTIRTELRELHRRLARQAREGA